MKLKSLIKIKEITIKDILLKKFTGKAVTSEFFFEIPSQPQNTCPLIDEAKDDFTDIIQEIESVHREVNRIFPEEKELEDCKCDSKENYLKNLKIIQEYSETLVKAKEVFNGINSDLEVLRSFCESTRNTTQDLKDLFWEYNNGGLSFSEFLEEKNNLSNLKKELGFSLEDLIKKYEKINLNHTEPMECYCEEKCESSKKNDLLEECFDLMYVNVCFSKYVGMSFNNLRDIEKWSEYVLKIVSSIEESQEKIKSNQEEIVDYVNLFNEHQKNVFLEKKDLMKNLQGVSIDNEIKLFLETTENMVLSKKLKDWELDVNKMIQEFNSIDLDQNYEDLIKVMGHFFLRVEGLKKMVDEQGINGRHSIDLSKALVPLRSKINSIYIFLIEQGPQFFEIID